jgi:hypothetical protein
MQKNSEEQRIRGRNLRGFLFGKKRQSNNDKLTRVKFFLPLLDLFQNFSVQRPALAVFGMPQMPLDPLVKGRVLRHLVG